MEPVIRQSNLLARKLNGKSYDIPTFEKEAMIAVTFDDGIISDYTVAYPEMTARGIKGTSFIIGSHVENLNKRMSWAQIRELQDSPMWDIQSHTFEHGDQATLTKEALIADYDSQMAVFDANGLMRPTILAYPYGSHSPLSHEVYDIRYRASRITNYNHTDTNTYDTFDKNNIKSVMSDTNDDTKLQFVKNAIDHAVANKGLLTLYLHEITPNVGTYPSATAKLYFLQIMDYIVQSGIKSVTISEMMDFVAQYKQRK